MSEEIVDKEVLFVLLNDNRNKILHFLQRVNDYASSRQIAEATLIKMSSVSFHSGKLQERGMVNKEIAVGKANYIINEKGIKVLAEVDKRQQRKGITGTPKKVHTVGSKRYVPK